MPDAHWGYGFPIGGVAAFDPDAGRRRLGRRRRLRHLLRRAHAAHRPHARPTSTRVQEGAGRRAVPARFPPASAAPARISLDADGDGRDAARAARAGRSSAATAREPISSASRSAAGWRGADPALRLRARQANASATRWARSARATTTSRCSRSPRSSTRDVGRGLRPARGRRRRQHPLRLARARPPDRHRVPASEMAMAAAELRHRAARPRAGLRADPLAGGPALPRRDARGDQLRAGQPPDHHAPDARGRSRRSCRRRGLDAALRRVAQHLQGRGARRRRQAGKRSSSIARARRAPSARAIRSCRRRCGRPASRC